MNRIIISLFVALLIAAPQATFAQDAELSAENNVSADIEIDPLAFALSGYSLHAGVSYNRYRLDLGVFGMDVPEMLHGNEDFDVFFGGYGAKFDVFLRPDQKWLFAGVEGSYNRFNVTDAISGASKRLHRGQVGARVGVRVPLPADFYVTPWVGVDYAIGAGEELIGGRTFEDNKMVIFPTIHLGRRFL